MRLKIISCEIAKRELAHVIPMSGHEDRPGVHSLGFNTPIEGTPVIQSSIDAVPPDTYDAILLGYGLCNNMIVDITARHTPLIVPRSHDCITWFLGSKKLYRELFDANPGTYYYTAGWLQGSSHTSGQSRPVSFSLPGLPSTWKELVEKYGEENAQYLVESLGSWTDHYTNGTVIVQGLEEDEASKSSIKEICENHSWEYGEIEGSMGLLKRWVCGDWDDDTFIRVEPGTKLAASNDESILQIESAH